MIINECIKCSSKNSIVKNIELNKMDEKMSIKNLFFNSEIFYLKTCLDCGYVEMYCASIVDKNIKKVKNKKVKE